MSDTRYVIPSKAQTVNWAIGSLNGTQLNYYSKEVEPLYVVFM